MAMHLNELASNTNLSEYNGFDSEITYRLWATLSVEPSNKDRLFKKYL